MINYIIPIYMLLKKKNIAIGIIISRNDSDMKKIYGKRSAIGDKVKVGSGCGHDHSNIQGEACCCDADCQYKWICCNAIPDICYGFCGTTESYGQCIWGNSTC